MEFQVCHTAGPAELSFEEQHPKEPGGMLNITCERGEATYEWAGAVVLPKGGRVWYLEAS